MTYIYNQTKLVFDVKSFELSINLLESNINSNKSVENLPFFSIKHDICAITLLQNLFPSVLVDIVTGYNGDVITHIINGHIMPSMKEYRIFVNTNECNFNIILAKGQTKIYFNGDNISHRISIDDIVCLKYVLDNNKFSAIINMNEDELYNECKHICKDIFEYNTCAHFFILMWDVIKHKYYEELITILYMIEGIVKN